MTRILIAAAAALAVAVGGAGAAGTKAWPDTIRLPDGFQPEGIAILEIGHDPRSGLRIAGKMLLDLDAPAGVELVIDIGEKVGFGDRVRHRILRRRAGLDAWLRMVEHRIPPRIPAGRHGRGLSGT